MALDDESPAERQERLERHEELLQRKDQRLANRSRPPAQGSKSVGAGFGEFFGALGDHKLMIFGGIGAVVVAIIVYNMIKNQNTGAATGGNQSPNYGAGGYVPSDIALSLDSINAQLSGLGTQISNLPAPPPPAPPPPKPVPVPTKPPVSPGGNPTGPPRHPLTFTVQRWPNKGSTLSGIAQLSGISLQRIEQLNPVSSLPSHNYNLIYPGEQIRIA